MNLRQRNLTYLIFALGIIFLSACLQSTTLASEASLEPSSLTFGVVPQQSATKLARKWVPVLDYLSAQSGYQIIFATAKDIPTFEKNCATGQYDLAYMNPYHYVVFHESAGYQAFAKEELKFLKGIIVVPRTSPYQKLEELDGATIALPSPGAFAASIITRAHLMSLGISFTPQYVSSHDSVYRSVAYDLFPAGGGVPRTLNNMEQKIRDRLRVLWTSGGYSPHAIASHPRIPPKIIKRITHSMEAMQDDPQGSTLLKNVHIDGLVAAQDKNWDDIRNLKLVETDFLNKE